MKRRTSEKIAIRCLFPTIRIPGQATKSLLFKTGIPQQINYLSMETVKNEFKLAVMEKKQLVSQDGSDPTVPFAPIRLSRF